MSEAPAEKKVLQRTVRVPIEFVPDETWMMLRKLAFECSRYGNHQLTQNYAKAKGVSGLTPYSESQDVLSSCIRDAVGRECVGIWRRLGKKILRGEQTLARFSADRALVIRDRGVRMIEREDGMHVILRLHPRDEGEATDLPVYMKGVQRDKRYLLPLLQQLVEGEYRISKASIAFERPGRKIYCLVSYQKPSLEGTVNQPPRKAALMVNEYGELWLRSEGKSLSLTKTVYRLKAMKENFAQIHSRLRRCLKRREQRRALLKAGSYETWARGVIHQLTAQIVGWCRTMECGQLQTFLPSDREIAWSEIIEMLEYKCENWGIAFEHSEWVAPVPKTDLQKLEKEVTGAVARSMA